MLGFGTSRKRCLARPNDRKIKADTPVVDKINALEPEFEKLSDEGLKDKTAELAETRHGGESLDDLLPEAFANCREAARRALGSARLDTQLMGGIFLHQGNISENENRRGQNPCRDLPAYLNALRGKGVHIVTVNDYLVKRDAEWMSKVYQRTGLTDGCGLSAAARGRKARPIACDITYATNNELGFDYLRDNMKSELNADVPARHILRLWTKWTRS